ncbi:hypothetical protein B0H19DRAFT_1350040 [Mycena capillaripes]|nr:hypothetical protein B0H19DRAFT_1350040 [Mycena capillaripes]
MAEVGSRRQEMVRSETRRRGRHKSSGGGGAKGSGHGQRQHSHRAKAAAGLAPGEGACPSRRGAEWAAGEGAHASRRVAVRNRRRGWAQKKRWAAGEGLRCKTGGRGGPKGSDGVHGGHRIGQTLRRVARGAAESVPPVARGEVGKSSGGGDEWCIGVRIGEGLQRGRGRLRIAQEVRRVSGGGGRNKSTCRGGQMGQGAGAARGLPIASGRSCQQRQARKHGGVHADLAPGTGEKTAQAGPKGGGGPRIWVQNVRVSRRGQHSAAAAAVVERLKQKRGCRKIGSGGRCENSGAGARSCSHSQWAAQRGACYGIGVEGGADAQEGADEVRDSVRKRKGGVPQKI